VRPHAGSLMSMTVDDQRPLWCPKCLKFAWVRISRRDQQKCDELPGAIVPSVRDELSEELSNTVAHAQYIE
jgi:hypothetical protein